MVVHVPVPVTGGESASRARARTAVLERSLALSKL